MTATDALGVGGGPIVGGTTIVSNLDTPGEVTVSFAGAKGIPSGPIGFLIIFFVLDFEAEPGTYPLGLEASLFDENGDTISSTSADGSVTVEETLQSPEPVSVEEVTAQPGQTGLEVAVLVRDAKGIAGGVLTLTYDSSVMTATDVGLTSLTSATGIKFFSFLDTPGEVRVELFNTDLGFLFGDPFGLERGSGALVNVTFDVDAEAVPGTSYTLGLEALLQDAFGDTISSTSADGSVTVTEKAPVIDLSETSLTFEDTNVGETSEATLTITNTGTASLSVTEITVIGADVTEYTVSPATATIEPGESQMVTVTFAPTSEGGKFAALEI